jgi:hypothetical protein
MRLTSTLIVLAFLIVGCEKTEPASVPAALEEIASGNILTVRETTSGDSVTYECVVSYSGSCFFLVSASTCEREGFFSRRQTCTTTMIDRFVLSPGESKKFAKTGGEILHCVTPFEGTDDKSCIPS